MQRIKVSTCQRTHVLDRAADGVGLGRLLGELLGQAKVSQLHRVGVRIQQQVLQLEVSVDDALALQVV